MLDSARLHMVDTIGIANAAGKRFCHMSMAFLLGAGVFRMVLVSINAHKFEFVMHRDWPGGLRLPGCHNTIIMRYFLFLLSVFLTIQIFGQDFANYTDTINHFSIQIPNGWRYGRSKDPAGLKLIAMRPPSGVTDTSNANYNVNIFSTPHNNLDNTFFDFIRYLHAEDLKIIQTGDTVLSGRKFKWLIETHKNQRAEVQMKNYDLVTVKNGKTYIITFVAFLDSFDFYKPLFDKIASSFRIL
jgi:hypothetical protein